jgi:hypothetical protein
LEEVEVRLGGRENMNNNEIVEIEIDIFEFAVRRAEVPHAHTYKVRIDCAEVRVETPHPTGEMLLAKVHKRPCAFELIAEYVHCESEVVEPSETVDLRKHGLKGFITAHREIVTIFLNTDPYRLERGNHSVAQILALKGQTPDGYMLLEEKDGPPMPVPPDHPVKIHGCEMFFSQPQSGGSS